MIADNRTTKCLRRAFSWRKLSISVPTNKKGILGSCERGSASFIGLPFGGWVSRLLNSGRSNTDRQNCGLEHSSSAGLGHPQCKSKYAVAIKAVHRTNVRIQAAAIRNLSSVRPRAIVAGLAANGSGVMLAILSNHWSHVHVIPSELSNLSAQPIEDV